MQPNDSDGRPTRRQTLQATLGGAATLTVGTGLVTADETDDGDGEDCDVTEADKERVREKWADQERLEETLLENEEIVDRLQENDLVAGEDVAVEVYARVVDCEVVPEYRIFRKTTQETNLTISLMAVGGNGYTIQRPWDDDYPYPCFDPEGPCPAMCTTDDCCGACHVGFCGPGGDPPPSDPYCCWTCNCACNDTNCSHHCDDDSTVIDAEGGWMTAILG